MTLALYTLLDLLARRMERAAACVEESTLSRRLYAAASLMTLLSNIAF
jgi:hypothetical protein